MNRLALTAVLLAACSRSESVKELDAYSYAVWVDQDTSAKVVIGSNLTLKIGDKTYALEHGDVRVPKDVWLTKNKLAMVIDTTCGPQEVPLSNVYDDEARMRQNAAKYDQSVKWKLVLAAPFDPQNVGIVVDNLDNAKPVTARVGTITKQIAAGAHASVGGFLGTCDTAREVALDGNVLGIAKTEGTSTLVDALGTRCYLESRDWYGAMAIEPSRDKLVAYAPGLYTIGQIDNWFEPNPTSTTVRVRDTESAKASAGTSLTSLTHTTCNARAARR